jgi:transcriptional regulator with XRE-family HTH domain
MTGNMFNFTKEMGEILVAFRKKARLSQSEVAKKMGLSAKSGDNYIIRLEAGRIKNPTLERIVLYLEGCGASLSDFAISLSSIRPKERHDKAVPSVRPPDIDTERLKNTVECKVRGYLAYHPIARDLIGTYLDFAFNVFRHALNPAATSLPDTKIWLDKVITPEEREKAGPRFFLNKKECLFTEIIRLVSEIVWTARKKASKPKPLLTEKQKKMGQGFLRYRVIMEEIETGVDEVLGAMDVSPRYSTSYKAFARKCYKALKKYQGKDILLLNNALDKIIEERVKIGLKQEILIKVREVTSSRLEGSQSLFVK